MSVHLAALTRRVALAMVALSLCLPGRAQDVRLPLKAGSLRFAAMGDTGTASREQNEVGAQMARYHAKFPFELVIMLGDNLYGGAATPEDFRTKFEEPYQALLQAGVKFYAALGNHDNPNERSYKSFNMGGARFYTFKPQQGVRFFALDSTYMDKPQLDWLEAELAKSGSEWKVCFFHHPLYSSGLAHGSSLDLRELLEPIFVHYGVNVVFAGHDHLYERIKPQKGIYYFTSGAGGSLRKDGLARADFTAAGFDQDFHFMLVEIDGDDLFFQAVSRTGQVVDAGSIKRPQPIAAPASPLPKTPSPAVSPKASASPVPSTSRSAPARRR